MTMRDPFAYKRIDESVEEGEGFKRPLTADELISLTQSIDCNTTTASQTNDFEKSARQMYTDVE